MSDKDLGTKKNSAGNTMLAIIAVLVLVAVGIYFFMPMKKAGIDTAPTPEATKAIDENAPEIGDVPPQPEPVAKEETSPQGVVVPTKTLDMPEQAEAPVEDGTNSAEQPAAEQGASVSEDMPSVDALMAPRTMGSDDAPIKVVEYSSLTCGHCATFMQKDFRTIKENYIDTGKVQFIFKEFPLNEPAVVASQVLRCMPEDKFDSFMELLFDQQEKWAYVPNFKDKVIQYAKLAGLSEEKANACIDNADLKKALIGNMKAATEKYKINSTPTFIVNDGEKIIVGHQPYSFFQETFEGLLSGKSSNAGVDKSAE